MDWLPESGLARILVIAALAALAHIAVRAARVGAERVLSPTGSDPAAAHLAAARRHPKLATLLSLGASTATFVLWFVAVGLIPGQQRLIEPGFRQRVVAWMKTRDEAYADWMVTVTLRA